MDGLSTILKSLEKLKKTRAADELNNVIDTCICNLHNSHGTF